MIPSGLFVQIGMIAISIGLVITYIKPTFDEIGVVQDNISTYQDQIENVSKVNDRLNQLVDGLNKVTNEDKERLATYLPNEIDEISINRDLLFITEESGATYVDVSVSGTGGNGRTSIGEYEASATAHVFELSVEGTYTEIKRLFELLAQNNYPLEVQNLEISGSEDGNLTASISLSTYSYGAEAPVGNINSILF